LYVNVAVPNDSELPALSYEYLRESDPEIALTRLLVDEFV